MLVCMGKERSHTPVPASISVSLLSKKLVVRVLVSMPPEHPNTLICIPVWFFFESKKQQLIEQAACGGVSVLPRAKQAKRDCAKG